MINKITSKFIVLVFIALFIVSCDDSTPVAPSEDHFEAAGYALLNAKDEVVFKVLNGKVVDSIATTLKLNLADGPSIFSIKFFDTNDKDLGVPNDVNKSLLIEIGSSEFATSEIHNWKFTLVPLAKGSTTIRIQILHKDHPDFTSPYVNMEIL